MAFIELHSSCGDSRPLYINTDHIAAVHGSFAQYDQTVVVLNGMTGYLESDAVYEVNESVETVMDMIAAIGPGYLDDDDE